jgi:hypothetical protein
MRGDASGTTGAVFAETGPSDANSLGHITNIVAAAKNAAETKLQIVLIKCLSSHALNGGTSNPDSAVAMSAAAGLAKDCFDQKRSHLARLLSP